jgi:hypothetical protein
MHDPLNVKLQVVFNPGTNVVEVRWKNQLYSSVNTKKTTIIWNTPNTKTWKLTNLRSLIISAYR